MGSLSFLYGTILAVPFLLSADAPEVNFADAEVRRQRIPTLAEVKERLLTAEGMTPLQLQQWSGVRPERATGGSQTWRFADGKLLTVSVLGADGRYGTITCWVNAK